MNSLLASTADASFGSAFIGKKAAEVEGAWGFPPVAFVVMAGAKRSSSWITPSRAGRNAARPWAADFPDFRLE